MVVFHHANTLEVNFKSGSLTEENELTFFIQKFFSHGIFIITVPIFFIISGYLFFLKFEGSISGFTNQCRKRFRSLLVPYFLW